MKLRTQFILAFVLLAVVPLGAITLYSYASSTSALRQAAEDESGRLAREMGQRMAVVTAGLSQRLDRLEELPLPNGAAGMTGSGGSPDPGLLGHLLGALGDAAPLIEALEFTPRAVPPPPPSGSGARPPRVRSPLRGRAAPGHPEAPAPPGETRAVIIPMPRFLGELAKDPKVASFVRGIVGLIPREEMDRMERDMKGALGPKGEGIARLVRARIEAAKAPGKAVPEPAAPGQAQTTAAPAPDATAPATGETDRDEVEREVSEEAQREAGGAARTIAIGREFSCEVKRDGQPVGRLRAKVDAQRLLGQVLSLTDRRQGEIPFARDAQGNLFTPDPADLPRIQEELGRHMPPGGGGTSGGDWVIVAREDASTGLTFGIVRPVGASLDKIRRASARNLFAGLGLSALALLGVLPISRRMTKDLSALTRSAGEIAAGRLDVRVPVRSRDELGQLASAFNRMAEDLRANQGRLVEQERLQKELELCREIQNELLPKTPLTYPFAEVQGIAIPARQVGGDFFNYFGLPDGTIALLMGDVSGKGVPAALLMANLQATLRARLPLEPDLASFARILDREIDASTPSNVYLTLFLGLLDPVCRELRYLNAGHESPYLLRVDGSLERLLPTGRPLGLMPGGDYSEACVPIRTGDRIFLYTDGLTDAENGAGVAFGERKLASLLAREKAADPKTLLAHVERAYLEHRGASEAADDVTLLVLNVGEWAAAAVAPAAAT